MLKPHVVSSGRFPVGKSSMRGHLLRRLSVMALLLIGVIGVSGAHAGASVDPADAGAAARAFLASLDDSQRSEAEAAINAADRGTWTYLAGPRTGLRLGDLTPEQRAAFDRFLAAALSEPGLRRVREVLAVEPTANRGGGVRTGPGEYWIRFYGTPRPKGQTTKESEPGDESVSDAWAWRLEGHHLSLNVAIVDGRVVSVTPFFFGAAPSTHAILGEPLALDDQRAERLLESLDPIQKAAAMGIGPAPADVRSGTGARLKMPRDGGVKAASLSKEQKAELDAMVIGLLDVWPAGSTTHLRKRWAETDPETVRFAWAGSVRRNGPHYWRVTSPALVLEFSNSSPAVNHAHLVLRTADDEFPGR
jgi:hypothetical protein